MGFSPAQQGKYRPLVEAAWQKHAQAGGLEPSNRAAREAWYRAELQACIGAATTADCNKGRDFDRLMARFELIARNDGLWVLREAQGEFRRLLWRIEELCRHNNITDAYARATAARVLKWPGYLNSLDDIRDEAKLEKVRIALMLHARRQGLREDRAAAQAALQAHPERIATPGERTGPDGLPQGPWLDERAATDSTFESPSKAHKRKAAEEQSRRLKRQDRLARTAEKSRKATQPAAPLCPTKPHFKPVPAAREGSPIQAFRGENRFQIPAPLRGHRRL